ncbi:MAG: PDZ domain-containing protein [Deltaproteobacteria bacterium]|nr:PDZ domain-containing protein [Deltaproteobacteria bacterium]
MRGLDRLLKLLILFGAFALSTWFALQFGSGGLWHGIDVAHAVDKRSPDAKEKYDLTRLEAVTATIQTIRDKYVDPTRVKPKDMLLSALNYVQKDVAQVIVLRDEGDHEVTVRVGKSEKKFRVDNVQGPWDVSAHLREIFAFLQENLKNSPEVDLREVEYAACNGMLHTLDPHSVFLSPEAYREMTISTQGAFGGVGIVISIRDQLLTVIKPMPGTPAGRAGLKRHDRIMRIGNESTLNMPLDDAVRRLRGEPGTPVVVHIRRDGPGGWQNTRPFELKREVINVESVESRVIEGSGVGYVRIKQFQSGTVGELDSALASIHRNEPKLRGLVLDLRSNPGGLLDQAAKVADRFLQGGIIVTTVSASEPRDEKVAKGPGTEPDYPLVVLVNSSSASASEIVAGALKNHNRAVIVGDRTFGKGSVQLVFPDITKDKAALKLTIAQYLTPGDISIQGVGITADIELDPMTVDTVEMDLMVAGKGMREGDLSKHLSSNRAHEAQKPLAQVRYNLPKEDREALRERGGDPEDTFELDFPVKFAKELVLHLPPATPRVEAVKASNEFIQSVEREELAKAAAELTKLGVDWSEAPAGAPGPSDKDLEVKVETDRPSNEVSAGGTIAVRATVKNNGKHPVYRLRAVTKSDNGYLDAKELIFGKIEPGKSKVATAQFGWCDIEGRKIGSTAAIPKNAKRVCTVPKDASTRADWVSVKFDSAGNHVPAPADIQVTVRESPRPTFAYSYQLVDNGEGANGDGRLQKGEGATMYLTVKNIGKGRSFETQANLRNLSGDALSLQNGRFDISNMSPGDTKSVAFTFQVAQQVKDPDVKLEVIVSDRDLGEYASEKLKYPVESALGVKADKGVSKAGAQGAIILDSSQSSARPFGKLASGTSVNRVGRVNDLTKVELGGGRFGFVSTASLVDDPTGTAADPVQFETTFSHAPPIIDFKASALSTRTGTVKMSGSIQDPAGLLDAYMFVGSRKVFYQPAQGGQDSNSMKVDFDASLRPGVNVITLIGRHNADTTARRTIIVRRDGPNGEILPTSKDADGELAGAPGE